MSRVGVAVIPQSGAFFSQARELQLEADGALGFVAQADEKVCQKVAAVPARASGH